jgi:hypothetical protein
MEMIIPWAVLNSITRKRWIFRKWEVGAWIVSSWLRIGTVGGHL